jgi:hypothetical protein
VREAEAAQVTMVKQIELEALAAEELVWEIPTHVEEMALLILALVLEQVTTIAVLLELAAQEL